MNIPSVRTLVLAGIPGAFVVLVGLFSFEAVFDSEIAHSTPTDSAPDTILDPSPTQRSRLTTVYFVPPDVDQSVNSALADGTVTREEYVSAVARTMTCLDQKGVGHTEPVYQEARGQYNYTIINNGIVSDQGLTPYDECWMRYGRDIQAQWVSQHS